jgi:hypothetical protein
MKKYVNSLSQLLEIQFPDSECTCYNDFGLEEEFLCDLCRSRLKKNRGKLKRRLRRESKKSYNKSRDE